MHPNIIHFHNIGPALFAPIAKVFGIGIVLTYHSPNYEHEKWGFVAKKALLFSEKVALKYADRIIFVNKLQMLKYSKPVLDKSVYIPNGITSPLRTSKTDFLDKWSLKKNKYILSVGRVTPEKGIDVLIKAYNLINRMDYKLVIAGSFDYETGYKKKLDSLIARKDVVFTGFVRSEDLSQLYSNAALFVLASNNEGFSIALLEAMSYGLPIIVSDISAMHMVNLDPESYFEKGNFIALKEKMEAKLNSDTVPHYYDLSRYNWDNYVNQLEDIYYDVANMGKK